MTGGPTPAQRRMMYGYGWVVVPSTLKNSFGVPASTSNPRIPTAGRLIGPFPAQIVWGKAAHRRQSGQSDELNGRIIMACTRYLSTAIMAVHMAPTSTPGTVLSYTYAIASMQTYFEPTQPNSIGFHHISFVLGGGHA
jgi:hypothetical protein